MRLSEKQIKEVARESGLSGALIKKITWNIRVEYLKSTSPDSGEEIKTEFYELGVRIADPMLLEKLKSPLALKELAHTIKTYANTCPIVINWITRGDFSVKKIPENINKSNIIHAARTAGRLRAQLIRKL